MTVDNRDEYEKTPLDKTLAALRVVAFLAMLGMVFGMGLALWNSYILWTVERGGCKCVEGKK